MSVPTNAGGYLVKHRQSYEAHFTQIPNAYLRDKRLTLKARGILSLLLSHEDGFRLSIKSISDGTPEGVDAVRTGVEELERAGYLEREPVRVARGKYGTTWTLLEQPASFLYGVKLTALENPTPLDNPTVTALDYPTQVEDQLKTLKESSRDNHKSEDELHPVCDIEGHTRYGRLNSKCCTRCGAPLVDLRGGTDS